MKYSPKVTDAVGVRKAHERGIKIRKLNSNGGKRVPVVAMDGEPQVIHQPWEHPNGSEVWLWSDGTLRAAPEFARIGCAISYLTWDLRVEGENETPDPVTLS